MTLRILATGGTFDKHYDPIEGKLGFSASHLPKMLDQAGVHAPYLIEELPLLDSLDMHDADRERILLACRQSPENKIVIVHGTDTMPETAVVIGEAALGKTVVLTGAMIPCEMTHSDALFNLGFAIGAVTLLPHGVYIAMHGQVFNWNHVRKNRAAGRFETT